MYGISVCGITDWTLECFFLFCFLECLNVIYFQKIFLVGISKQFLAIDFERFAKKNLRTCPNKSNERNRLHIISTSRIDFRKSAQHRKSAHDLNKVDELPEHKLTKVLMLQALNDKIGLYKKILKRAFGENLTF